MLSTVIIIIRILYFVPDEMNMEMEMDKDIIVRPPVKGARVYRYDYAD